MRVPEFKIIKAPHALLLVGADALRPGHYNEHGWTYRALGGEIGFGGFVEFTNKAGQSRKVALACSPEFGAPRVIQRLDPVDSQVSAVSQEPARKAPLAE